ADPPTLGDALLDRPGCGIDEGVVHLAAPLAGAGVQQLLTEAYGPTILHAKHRIAAVCQKLEHAVRLPAVPRIGDVRASVDGHQKWEGLLRPSVPVGIASDWEVKVAGELQPVPRRYSDGVTRGEVVLLQFRVVGKEEGDPFE